MNKATLLVLSLVSLLSCHKQKAQQAHPTEATSTPVTAAPASATLPTTPATATSARFFVGGDARNDKAKVLPWAFTQAKEHGAAAFLFLGDMEITGDIDQHFKRELAVLSPVPFYPAIGNHELNHKKGKTKADAEKAYQKRFLGKPQTPVSSAFEDKVVYSAELPGGVHFIALDNVSQKGFGADQLRWLDADLTKATASPTTRHIFVGMHKPLANNGVTKHAMDEDGDDGLNDSKAALASFQKYKVELILASHLHEFMKFTQGGIPSYISGGLGAPVVTASTSGDAAARRFHHVLEIDVGESKIDVTVLRFPGTPDAVEHDDDDVPNAK